MTVEAAASVTPVLTEEVPPPAVHSPKPLGGPSLARRQFLGAVAAAAVAPTIVPSRVRGATAPSNRLRVAQIGTGRIARVHDMPGVLKSGLADIVAVCDLDRKRVFDAQSLVLEHYQKAQLPAPTVSVWSNATDLLAQPDIDAVVISTPDHWHAELTLAALRAGKDVYVQKPFTLTHEEGVALREAAQKSGRIVQIGSQQRSWEQFRMACELVRNGRLGAIRKVEIGLPIDPTEPDDPAQPVPENFDYERWLGPTPLAYYTERRVHPQRDYSRPGWLRNDAYCLGMITGWGSHHFDTMHWALNLELSGPSRVEARAEFPKNSIWNVHGAYDVQLAYPNGIAVSVSDKHPNGLKFIGDDGWLWVTREGQQNSPTGATPAGKPLPILDASDPRLLAPTGNKSVELPHSTSHHQNWLECVRSRAVPLAPPAVAHRSGSACIVSWIAMKLGRPLNWDVKAERFVGDAQANAMLARPERAPHGMGRLLRSPTRRA